jgi:hypothetical protein
MRRVEDAAGVLQQRMQLIFGGRVSGVVVPSVARIQAYHIRHVLLRIEQTARMDHAKQRLWEAIAYLQTRETGKNIQIIVDVDPM